MIITSYDAVESYFASLKRIAYHGNSPWLNIKTKQASYFLPFSPLYFAGHTQSNRIFTIWLFVANFSICTWASFKVYYNGLTALGLTGFRNVAYRKMRNMEIELKKAPQKWELLYKNLFCHKDHRKVFIKLSKGIIASIENANRLIQDVELLVKEKRYASAGFLLVTADEEMAKSYILMDACLLDFSKHSNVLKRLCKAFYSHIAKYAYNEVIRFSNFSSMAHVKDFWDSNIVQWSPGDYYSGEPDMPHETYFEREMPLYVDFIDYDQAWWVPEADTRKEVFEPLFGDNALVKSQKALENLSENSKIGLYKPESLSILNDIFKNHYIAEKTPIQEIVNLCKKAAQRIEDELDVPKEAFSIEWPLYDFVDKSKF